MAGELTWDLGAITSYIVGRELECTLTFTAPQDGTYYLMGALYDADLVYISGTLFGILRVAGEDYAVNDSAYMSEWALDEDEEVEQDCKFILGRTNATLGLFLQRRVGDEPSLEDDVTVDSVSVALSGPAAELDIMSLMMMVMVVGVMGVMMGSAFKK